jgi:hypothetical protein
MSSSILKITRASRIAYLSAGGLLALVASYGLYLALTFCVDFQRVSYWFSYNWSELSSLIVIFSVLTAGCWVVFRSRKESWKFVCSAVGIFSGVFALLFSFLPLGCWWSAGIVRWQGGCPFYFIVAQGDTPTATSDWGFTPMSWGLWYVWFTRLPADLAFWMILMSFGAIAAKRISKLAKGNIRWHYLFAVFICLLIMAYSFTFGGVWHYIFLSYLLH